MTTLNNKIYTVFGGSGFIGSHLCDSLLNYNPKKLVIFDNLSGSTVDNIKYLLKDNRVELVKGDNRDYDLVEKYVLESDLVFNLVASTVGNSIINPRIDLQTNIEGVFNILQAMKKKSEVRMVHCSSGSVVNSSTPYSISKLAGEKYCQFFAKEWGVRVSVVRYYHVYGERQPIDGTSGVINIFLNKILRGLPPVVWGDGNSQKNFTYVLDSVRATLLLAQDDSTIGKVYDVASDMKISIKELAHLLINIYSDDKSMQPIYDKPKIGENFELYPDTTAIKALGWKTETSFEDGLDNCKKWVESQIN